MPNTFTYKGKEYEYVDLPHNTTRLNERGVELSLGRKFLESFDDLIEIGAVSPYYFDQYTHEVFDLTDNHPRSQKKDARKIDTKGKNMLSISTVEHFGSGTVTYIEKVMKECPHYLITFPLGYSDDEKLDAWALSTKQVRFIGRAYGNEWSEKKVEDLNIKYGPRWANTIVVIENCL